MNSCFARWPCASERPPRGHPRRAGQQGVPAHDPAAGVQLRGQYLLLSIVIYVVIYCYLLLPTVTYCCYLASRQFSQFQLAKLQFEGLKTQTHCAHVCFDMPFESSNLPGTVPIFPFLRSRRGCATSRTSASRCQVSVCMRYVTQGGLRLVKWSGIPCNAWTVDTSNEVST